MDEELARRALEEALGYVFEDETLLLEALTHRSFANEQRDRSLADNEKLEFLGDAVLGLTAAHLLHEAFPNATEGELTRRRADLVCEATLAELATEIGIGDALRLGKGEARSGGRSKPRLLASGFEAVVGALYLDGGSKALSVCSRLLRERVPGSSPGTWDFKSRIQEHVQARGSASPSYAILRSEGPDHRPRFVAAVSVDGEVVAEGEGWSKLEAEQAAARRALQELGDESDG